MDSRVKELVKKSKRVVFFGGAGVSTESGIPDFRSEDGLYQAQTKYGHSPEEMLSHTFFMNHTETFYDYYKHNMLYPDVQPNKAHFALAKLETQGKLKAVVTQNIDGLHQLAGSRKVFELHGSVLRNYCTRCHTFYSLDYILRPDSGNRSDGTDSTIPRCIRCGGIIKLDVVLYEEPLDQEVMEGAVDAIAGADLLIVGGTSLVVYPAAGLINYFSGDNLVLINKSETQYDHRANLVIHDSIGAVLGQH
ncbi:MAG TPA: NAD-dependent protein deacylase [Anaerovoracaceae bacterium]|nr:NAD-dependent protein deacylase [Anaerovoracaceae bacterium]